MMPLRTKMHDLMPPLMPLRTKMHDLMPPLMPLVTKMHDLKRPPVGADPSTPAPLSLGRINRPYRTSVGITDCGVKYAKVLDNPFTAPEGACLPVDNLSLPTEKVRIMAKSLCTVQANGSFFFLMKPGWANDLIMGWQNIAAGTTATSATVNAFVGGGTPTTLFTTDFTYATSRFTTRNALNVQGRLVGYGMRATYTGANQTRSGIFYAFEAPTHQDLGNYTFDSILQDENTIVQAVSDKPVSVYWSGPKTQNETVFYSNPEIMDFQNSVNPVYATAPMVIWGSGLPAASTVLLEWCYHVEYAGPGIGTGSIEAPGMLDLVKVIQQANAATMTNPGPNKRNTGIPLAKQSTSMGKRVRATVAGTKRKKRTKGKRSLRTGRKKKRTATHSKYAQPFVH